MSIRHRSLFLLSLAILGSALLRLWFRGLSGWGLVALVAAILWFAFELIHMLVSRLEKPQTQVEPSAPSTEALSEDSETESLISLVYFLSESREVDVKGIQDCVTEALDLYMDSEANERQLLIVPFLPAENSEDDLHIRHFMLRIPAGNFAILVSDRPYIDDPASFAKKSIRDKRLRSAVEQHQAWISVDRIDGPSGVDAEVEAYRTIGKLLAAMAGPDCLAIYCPRIQRCNEFDPSLIEILKSQTPLSLFEEPTFEPVIEISDNDPKMAAAVAEAKARWPEFVAAFSESSPRDRHRFIIKAEFREGRKSEFMWVCVEGIERDKIHGTLMNDPHELLGVHRGAEVTISLEKLNDWIYPRQDGQHTGGFTLDVLADDRDEEN